MKNKKWFLVILTFTKIEWDDDGSYNDGVNTCYESVVAKDENQALRKILKSFQSETDDGFELRTSQIITGEEITEDIINLLKIKK